METKKNQNIFKIHFTLLCNKNILDSSKSTKWSPEVLWFGTYIMPALPWKNFYVPQHQ